MDEVKQLLDQGGPMRMTRSGTYWVRIIKTTGLHKQGELKLVVPDQVRYDTAHAVVMGTCEGNPLGLEAGDIVLLNMKQGAYGFEKDGQALDTKYLVHPGELIGVDSRGRNHFVVDQEDILVRLRRDE